MIMLKAGFIYVKEMCFVFFCIKNEEGKTVLSDSLFFLQNVK